jgi:hypothetical protein
MATPVQITVTVDSNGAVTGFQQIGGAATTMGQEVSTSGLKGQAAIDALTKQWNAEQAAIAAVNARIKENMAAHTAQAAEVEKTSKLFQGLANDQTKASVAGRLLEQQFGLTNRALNQVAARSAILGPLMAAALPIGIAAAFLPMIISIGEGIAHAAQAAGGMTEAVKKMNEETLKANEDAFLHPKSLGDTQKNLNQVNDQIKANEILKGSVAERGRLVYEESSTMAKILGIADIRAAKEIFFNSAVDKGVKLTHEQTDLIEHQVELLQKAGVEQAALSAEGSALHGFAKLKLDEAKALNDIANDKTLDGPNGEKDTTARASKEYFVAYEFHQKRIELEQSETDKTIALRHQVEDETLHGTAKILSDEAAAVDQLTRMQQRSGGDYAQFQQQKVLIHLKALNQLDAYNAQQDARVREYQDRAEASALTGDAAILASAQKEKQAVGALYAKGELDDAHYNAIIRQINIETNAKIAAEDQKTFDKAAQIQAKTVEMQQRAAEDMKTAQEDAALAAVPEWQRASAQIDIELNRRERAIEDQKIKELAAEHLTQDQIVAINQDADAKKYDAMVQANVRIQEENKRLTEQLGSDLQSVFDDIGSGNIGKRILANMEKMFFQIVAQWILSLNIMKSAAGSIMGSIVFGPGSTGAGVFGGGGGSGTSILGSLFGHGGGSSAPSGAAFQPGGIFSDPSTFAGGSVPFQSGSGLSSAIAGTGAAPGGGVLTSASNALTTSTMADALGATGAGAASVTSGAAKASGFSSLLNSSSLAALVPLGLTALGSTGGKVGLAGGVLGSLLLTGHLSTVVNALYSSLGLGATGAIAGGAVGGLLGFGIGSNHGGLLGSLAGAGSGALTGFVFGGPIGALVGGIVGLLGGIFGGILGGSKRKKQANALADNTLLPEIAQIGAGFDGFQIDSASAIQQLEQLRSDSQKQLSALKGQGNDVFNLKVAPNIDIAEQHIRDTQAERDRRSAVAFGPPQFDTGGIFSMRGGNAGLAVLHDGEAVINPTATKKNLNTIAAMNAGGKVGGVTIHGGLNVTANKLDRAYIMSSEFQKDLLDALGRATVEGKW